MRARLTVVVASAVVVLAVVAIGVVVLDLRSVDRNGSTVRFPTDDRRSALFSLEPARWWDRADVSAGDARRACGQPDDRCALAPDGSSRLVLVRFRGEPTWAFVGDADGFRYVTLIDADDGRVLVAAAGSGRWRLDEPPLGPGMRIGVPYHYHLNVHCGVEYATFDGRGWITDTPLDDGQGNPPPDWDQPGEVATMTLVDHDAAAYRYGTWLVRFRPVDPARDPRPGPCA